MMSHTDCPSATALLRLCVVAEEDPSALTRILGHFQTLNLVPRRVVAQLADTQLMYVEIDIAAISEHRLTLLASKVEQLPCVLNASYKPL